MPTNIVDVSTFSSPVAVPASADARTAASVATPFQSLSNRTKFLYDQLPNGVLIGGDSAEADGVNTSVKVSALSVVIGGVLLAKSTETDVSLSALTTGTWYYVYAYNNAGAVGFEVSSVAPDAARVWKSSTTTHRYLCAGRAAGATTFVPFRKSGNRYTYRASAQAADALIALNGSAGTGVTSWTTNGLTHYTTGYAMLPPHARIATLRGSLQRSGGTATLELHLRTNGDTTSTLVFVSMGGELVGGRVYGTHDFPTNASRQVQWAATSSSNATIDVVGFSE